MREVPRREREPRRVGKCRSPGSGAKSRDGAQRAHCSGVPHLFHLFRTAPWGLRFAPESIYPAAHATRRPVSADPPCCHCIRARCRYDATVRLAGRGDARTYGRAFAEREAGRRSQSHDPRRRRRAGRARRRRGVPGRARVRGDRRGQRGRREGGGGPAPRRSRARGHQHARRGWLEPRALPARAARNGCRGDAHVGRDGRRPDRRPRDGRRRLRAEAPSIRASSWPV
jgi:hypothetical protein